MLDLDIIGGKQETIKLNGEEIAYRNVTLEESLLLEYEAKEIEEMPATSKEDIKEVSKRIADYLTKLFELDKAKAKKITLAQFKAIRKHQARIDLYDQGFTDAEIDKLEKKFASDKLFQG